MKKVIIRYTAKYGATGMKTVSLSNVGKEIKSLFKQKKLATATIEGTNDIVGRVWFEGNKFNYFVETF